MYGTSQGVDLVFDGHTQGSYGDPCIQAVPVSQEEALLGKPLLAKGYCVDTVGLDAEMIRKYVKYQEDKERHQEQLPLKYD